MRRIVARLFARRVQEGLCVLSILGVPCVVHAHDLERTQVVLRLERDGSFVLDVSNDPLWLRDRMQSIPGPFADRVVLWVDGREIRAESVELIHGADADTHRLRGRMPMDAKTLRWFYGLVIDPYPMTIHRADGRIAVEEVMGGAWSDTIDLSGQFHPSSWLGGRLFAAALIVGILLVPPMVWLLKSRR